MSQPAHVGEMSPELQVERAKPSTAADTAISRRPLLLIGTDDFNTERVMGVRDAIAKRLPSHEVIMVVGGTFATEVSP